MNRSVMVLGGTLLLGVLLAAPDDASAGSRRSAGIIGGMSAAEVVGAPYYQPDGYGYYAGYAASAHYGPPSVPPPGCIIRQQRVWDGYRWSWRKLRLCH